MDTDNTGITMRLTKRMRSLLRPPPFRSEAAPRRRAGGAADDAGFTPAEIIIGVILVGILATGVTIKAVQMMEQARDSAAQSTLRTAAQAANGVFGIVLKGGTGNFAGLLVEADTTLGSKLVGLNGTAASGKYSETVIDDAITHLEKQEPNVTFRNSHESSPAFPDLNAYPPDGAVWVEVNTARLKPTAAVTLADAGKNPNKHDNRLGGASAISDKVAIRAGDLIRLGIVSAGGSTFCLVRVADSYDGIVSGDGWQAVNEKHTLAGMGADCGAEVADNEQFKEMPKTVGTDPTMSSPTDNLNTTVATGKTYVAP